MNFAWPYLGCLALLRHSQSQTAHSIRPMTPEHMAPVAELPMLHKDTFDRLLIAQARHEGMSIVTADEQFATYDVRIVW